MDAPHDGPDSTKFRHGTAGRSQGSPGHAGPAAPADDVTLGRIGEALKGLRYGSVLTIVQDGVVVQIERTEKTRFGR